MALKNTVIPNENLSNRERIERKIASFEGRPFTLKDINRLLRPRMRLEAMRFHVENMVNNLYIEKLPRKGREAQLYVARDLLKDLEADADLNGAAHDYLTDLYNLTVHLRSGYVIPIDGLKEKRAEMGRLIDRLRDELTDLEKLHDCTDLWDPVSLVKRLGFIEDEYA